MLSRRPRRRGARASLTIGNGQRVWCALPRRGRRGSGGHGWAFRPIVAPSCHPMMSAEPAHAPGSAVYQPEKPLEMVSESGTRPAEDGRGAGYRSAAVLGYQSRLSPDVLVRVFWPGLKVPVFWPGRRGARASLTIGNGKRVWRTPSPRTAREQ